MTQYKLYALPVGRESVRYVTENERFCRITSDYILVYTDTCFGNIKHAEITEKEFARMTEQDIQWFKDVCVAVVSDAVSKNQYEVIKNITEMLERFEEELEAEQEKLEEQNNG